MDKIIVDTNVYIDFFNSGQFSELFFQIKYPTLIYLSSIVLMELRAGAFTRTDIKIVHALERTYRKNRRLLSPVPSDFVTAGEILARLQQKEAYELKKTASITNDVLIALGARRIGATVITQNRKDFEAIRRARDLKLFIL
jgi:predicted nucleic acid-binding protein